MVKNGNNDDGIKFLPDFISINNLLDSIDDFPPTDDICFLCKDGGELIECDWRCYSAKNGERCLKCYHAYCLDYEVRKQFYHWIYTVS